MRVHIVVYKDKFGNIELTPCLDPKLAADESQRIARENEGCFVYVDNCVVKEDTVPNMHHCAPTVGQ